jgi:hypothetical protein
VVDTPAAILILLAAVEVSTAAAVTVEVVDITNQW